VARADSEILSDAQRRGPKTSRAYDGRMSTSTPTGDSARKDPADSAIKALPSPRERRMQDVGVTSPAVRRAMEAETAFLEGITGKPDTKRFTDRRPIPGRGREAP
jgi:hypothetical protein